MTLARAQCLLSKDLVRHTSPRPKYWMLVPDCLIARCSISLHPSENGGRFRFMDIAKARMPLLYGYAYHVWMSKIIGHDTRSCGTT